MRFTLATVTVIAAFAVVRAADTPKPRIKVSADGFPAGHDTPEGAACDLARAFIKRDVKLFRETCVRPSDERNSRDEYSAFLKDTAAEIEKEAARKEPSPDGPRTIAKVLAARSLSRGGPASFGWAAFGYQDVKFVDVGAILHNGQRCLNRTLVIKDKAGRWYVHPLPGSVPLLSTGLNEETDSEKEFTDVYQVEK
jgi:hypothetical protein